MPENSSQKEPLITIGITCHNAEDTIGRAIGSALNHNWARLEIIVVDDGSTDRSWEIIGEFAERDPRLVRIRHEANRGYAGALNTIVDASTGEYIAIFDDDDVSKPDRVSKQWKRLIDYTRAHGTDLVFCYSNRTVVGHDGRQTTPLYAIGRKPAEPCGQIVADYLLWHYQDFVHTWGQFGSCTLLASKETFEKIGPLDEDFRRSAEWDLAVRLALMGGHFIAVDEPLITQYKTTSADKGGTVPLIYSLKLRKKYKSFLKKKRVYLASIAIAYARFYYAINKSTLSRFYILLACLCSPSVVLRNELDKRKRRNQTGD